MKKGKIRNILYDIYPHDMLEDSLMGTRIRFELGKIVLEERDSKPHKTWVICTVDDLQFIKTDERERNDFWESFDLAERGAFNYLKAKKQSLIKLLEKDSIEGSKSRLHQITKSIQQLNKRYEHESR